MELTWKASEPASALYAATCLNAGLPVADARLAEAFAPALAMAVTEFDACAVPADRLLPVLTGFAGRGVDENRQLVEQSLSKVLGRPSDGSPLSAAVGRLAGAVAGLKAAFQQAYRATSPADASPLVDELELRSRPLMEQWEARGNGLLLQIARSTEENVLASAAEVALVYPLVGGNGMACRPLNAVTFEAVLTNPVEQLPEVTRLAWLLAQLNLDLPAYCDHISAARREAVGQWALVPPVLAAAEYVELAPLSTESLARALTAWRLVDASVSPDELSAQAATLQTWWQTYEEGQTPWAVALGALERMLFSAEDSS